MLSCTERWQVEDRMCDNQATVPLAVSREGGPFGDLQWFAVEAAANHKELVCGRRSIDLSQSDC